MQPGGRQAANRSHRSACACLKSAAGSGTAPAPSAGAEPLGSRVSAGDSLDTGFRTNSSATGLGAVVLRRSGVPRPSWCAGGLLVIARQACRRLECAAARRARRRGRRPLRQLAQLGGAHRARHARARGVLLRRRLQWLAVDDADQGQGTASAAAQAQALAPVRGAIFVLLSPDHAAVYVR